MNKQEWIERFQERYYDKGSPSGLKQGREFIFFKDMMDDVGSFISNLLKEQREEIIGVVEEQMRSKCICHGGPTKKEGAYFVCCVECKNSAQCFQNKILYDIITRLKEMK